MSVIIDGTTGITTPTGTITTSATVAGVNVVAVAPSTAGNVLTSTGSAWASTAPAPATGSLTLLATLTTTSGTTQSATGLATTYNNLVIVAIGVNTASATEYLMATSANNGSSYGTAVNIGSYGSTSENAASTILFGANQSVTIRPFLSGYGAVVASSTSGAINAIRFSLGNAGAFTAGTIYIYGWN